MTVWPLILYVLALEAVSSTPPDLWNGRGAMAYLDDVPIIVFDEGQLPCVEKAIK